MKPLVSEPLDSHYASMSLDELQTEVFDGFCSEDTMIGYATTTPPPPPPPPPHPTHRYYLSNHGLSVHKLCSDWPSELECGIDSSCAWASDASACVPSVCPTFCDEVTCVAAAASDSCGWDASTQLCSRDVCVSPDQSSCVADALCWWDTKAASVGQTTNLCKPAVGCHREKTPADCASDTCKWEMESMTYAPPLLPLPHPHPHLHHNRCTDKRKCTIHFAKDECNDDISCVWNSAAGSCDDKDGCRMSGMVTTQPFYPLPTQRCPKQPSSQLTRPRVTIRVPVSGWRRPALSVHVVPT